MPIEAAALTAHSRLDDGPCPWCEIVRASRNIAFCASCPPFVPNRAAISAADATTSLAVKGVAGIPFER